MTSKYLFICLAAFAAALLMLGCNHYDNPTEEQTAPISTNISIAELRRLVGEKALPIEQELIIGGYVTSSDEAGNFYRTFTLEDATGGVEIMAGMYDLHNLYPEGHYVVVKLSGCVAAIHEGMLQVGRAAKSYSIYPTDYFASRQALDKHIICYDVKGEVVPSAQCIGSLKDELCGRLVKISHLTLCSAEHAGAWEVNGEGRWTGYNLFCDGEGREIAVFTSEYANYAEQEIVAGEVALTGILHRGVVDGEEYYMIKMRDENDCQILD